MALTEAKKIEKGARAPRFRLKNYDDTWLSLDNFSHYKLLLIVFTCNHCPYAKASWSIIEQLRLDYEKEGLGIVAINPNNNPKYPDDDFLEMKPFVKEWRIRFPYLWDEDQKVAKNYQATCTPDPFLFLAEGDGNFSLYYHGRFNDNWQEPEKIKEHSMKEFIEAALGKREIPQKSFPSIGCNIKWVDDIS